MNYYFNFLFVATKDHEVLDDSYVILTIDWIDQCFFYAASNKVIL